MQARVTHLGLWRDYQHALELAVLPLSDRIPLVRERGTGPSSHSELSHAAVRTRAQRQAQICLLHARQLKHHRHRVGVNVAVHIRSDEKPPNLDGCPEGDKGGIEGRGSRAVCAMKGVDNVTDD